MTLADTKPHQVSIDLSTNLDRFFAELVERAMVGASYTPSITATTYVTGLLTAFAQPGCRLGLSLADAFQASFTMDEAGARGPTFERVRHLGDSLLYLAGFFAEHLERRGSSLDSARWLGAAAYHRASRILTQATPRPAGAPVERDLFDELAAEFDSFAGLLERVSGLVETHGARPPRGVVELYEHWMRTGSQRSASRLALLGVLPSAGRPGLH